MAKQIVLYLYKNKLSEYEKVNLFPFAGYDFYRL
jgi:hypothetical protein